MAVLGGLRPNRQLGALAGGCGMAMVEILGVAGGIVNLALGVVPPLNHIGGAVVSRLADDRAAACGEGRAAFAQRRGRLGFALPPIHRAAPPLA